jgi:hypothetical protein
MLAYSLKVEVGQWTTLHNTISLLYFWLTWIDKNDRDLEFEIGQRART